MLLKTFTPLVQSSYALILCALSVSAHSFEDAPNPKATKNMSAWETISPGGNTQCSDGSDYQFHVKPGNPNKLLVFLNGGGACWNAQTCDISSKRPAYVPRVDLSHNDPNHHSGIFELSNPSNPAKDWTMVFVPYCTGDVHLGSSTQQYKTERGREFTINHFGAINSQAVLDWIADNLSPSQVLVSGASAGALAAPIVAGQMASLFSDADIVSFADGAAGYRSPVAIDILSHWGAFAPLNKDKYDNFKQKMQTFYSFYSVEKQHHPLIRFALYDSDNDHVQVMFNKMLGETGQLLELIGQTYEELSADNSALSYYLANGNEHTILRYSRFYTTEQEGKPFADWFNKLMNQDFPASVDCRGDDKRC